MKALLWSILAASLLVTQAWADDDTQIVRTISVQGKAKQQVEPDRAHVNFAMESRAQELDEVKRMQDEKLGKLYQLAGELQIEKKHLKTQRVQLYPEYRYHEGKQLFKGYRASIAVSMTLEDIDKVGPVMQALVKAGFDRVNNVRYSIKDEQALREALQLKAIKNARQKAVRMADALDMEIGDALQINESGLRMAPPLRVARGGMAMMESAVMSADAAPAPPTGEQEMRATVSVQFELVD